MREREREREIERRGCSIRYMVFLILSTCTLHVYECVREIERESRGCSIRLHGIFNPQRMYTVCVYSHIES